jgi:hypothetical protein
MASQQLGDILAGFGGHPVDRQGLNTGIAQAQALNGLRSAQTMDAMANARKAQDEAGVSESKQAAQKQMSTYLTNLFPGHADIAEAISNSFAAGGGNMQQLAESFDKIQDLINQHTITDPGASQQDKYNAGQALEKKYGPINVPNSFIDPNNPTAGPQLSPSGASTANEQNALAHLHTSQAATAGQPTDPNEVAYGAYMLYKTGKMPSLGMKGGPERAQMISGAAQLANQEQQNPGSTVNPAFDKAIENGQDFVGAQRAVNSAAGGTIGNQMRSINNVVGHLQLFENTFQAIQNGDNQTLNKLNAGWQREFGQPAPTTIQTIGQVVGPELTKILAQTGAGSTEERQQFPEIAGSLVNAPEQTGAAVGALKNMVSRQAADLALQYHGATGRGDFAKRYMAGDVAQYLDMAPDAAQPTPAPATGGGGPVHVVGSPATGASAAASAPPAATGGSTPAAKPAGGAAGASGGPAGWHVETDAGGNRAWVSPDRKQFQEIPAAAPQTAAAPAPAPDLGSAPPAPAAAPGAP